MTHKGSVFRDLMIIETAIKTGTRRAELANLLSGMSILDQVH